MVKKTTEAKKTTATKKEIPKVAEDPKVTAIKNALTKWTKLLDKPEIAEKFEGYEKTMQFSFPDIKVNLMMVFKDKKVQVVEGLNPKAEMSLTCGSQLFMDILEQKMDPMEAFSSGDLQPKGSMDDLEKLQIFIES
jgi:putative sterol carrier protein